MAARDAEHGVLAGELDVRAGAAVLQQLDLVAKPVAPNAGVAALELPDLGEAGAGSQVLAHVHGADALDPGLDRGERRSRQNDAVRHSRDSPAG